VLVSADSTAICSHPLLEGKNHCSRRNEHFEGLLKQILNEPCTSPKKRLIAMPNTDEYSVEERGLALYDALFEEVSP